jgi:hypothetical protein
LLAVYNVNLLITCVVVCVDNLVLLAVKANRCKRTNNVNVDLVQEASQLVRRPPRDLLLRVAEKADFAGKVVVVCKA